MGQDRAGDWFPLGPMAVVASSIGSGANEAVSDVGCLSNRLASGKGWALHLHGLAVASLEPSDLVLWQLVTSCSGQIWLWSYKHALNFTGVAVVVDVCNGGVGEGSHSS